MNKDQQLRQADRLYSATQRLRDCLANLRSDLAAPLTLAIKDIEAVETDLREDAEA